MLVLGETSETVEQAPHFSAEETSSELVQDSDDIVLRRANVVKLLDIKIIQSCLHDQRYALFLTF